MNACTTVPETNFTGEKGTDKLISGSSRQKACCPQCVTAGKLFCTVGSYGQRNLTTLSGVGSFRELYQDAEQQSLKGCFHN